MPKRYSGEYKQAAIQDCQNGIPIDEVSQTRGIAVSTIYRWLKDCAEEIPHPHYSALLRKKEHLEHVWAMRIKKFCLLGAQPHDAVVSCGCRFAVPAKFRGKINLPDKVIVYVNALGAMAAGFIRGVDNYLFHKLT